MGSRVEPSIRHPGKSLAAQRRDAESARDGGLRAELEARRVRSPNLSPDAAGLTATIVAVLDRDNELRHDYLLKRWRGVIA